ncbi:MAG: hypothetical protein GY862_34110 [Gammaproteobacteria bacterium]|nr:hypothetical protein [Gammaproteobacteria bacterium]
MSIAVAVRKDDKITIAADTMTNFGSNKVPLENYRCDKITRMGDSYVAATGWGIYENILEDYLADAGKVSLRNSKEIFAFFMKLWGELHRNYSFVNDQANDKESPFGDLDSNFLITNKHGIFHVSSNMSVTYFKEYFAIGSGSDFSLGAIHALYSQDIDAETIAKKAVECATVFNIYCGGEIDAFTVTAEAGTKKRVKKTKEQK